MEAPREIVPSRLPSWLAPAAALLYPVACARVLAVALGIHVAIAVALSGCALGAALRPSGRRLPARLLALGMLALLLALAHALALGRVERRALGVLLVALPIVIAGGGRGERGRGALRPLPAVLAGAAAVALQVLAARILSLQVPATLALVACVAATAMLSPSRAWHLGGAAGALAAGFVIPAAIGLASGAFLAGAVLLGVGLAGARGRARILHASGLLACAVLLLVCGGRPVLLATHAFRASRRQLVAAREGAFASAAVARPEDRDERVLYVDAIESPAAGSRRRALAVLGHLPLLLCRERGRALCLGLGTGTTAAAMAAHPLRSLTVVEESPEVLALAPLAGAPVRDVIVDDARAVLREQREGYDAIALEPILPHAPTAVFSCTTQFYRLARERLAPGGVLVSWAPPALEPPRVLEAVLAAFAEAFPGGLLFLVDDVLLLAGFAEDAPRLDRAALDLRLAEPDVQRDLAAALMPTADELLSTCVGRAAEIASGRGWPVMSDWRNALDDPWLAAGRDVLVDYARNLESLASGAPLPALVALLGGSPPGELATFCASRALVRDARRAAALEAREALAGGRASGSRARALYREALRVNPHDRTAAERLDITPPTAARLRAALQADETALLRDWEAAFPREVAASAHELLAAVVSGAIGGREADLLLTRLPLDLKAALRERWAEPGGETREARLLVKSSSPEECLALARAPSTAEQVIALIDAAGEAGDARWLVLVLAFLDHADAQVRTHAAIALARLAGDTLGYDPAHPETAAAARARAAHR